MRATTIEAILGRFSLHDSGLHGVTIDPMGRVLLEIAFDREWNQAIQEGLDTLLIRYERVYRMTWTSGAWVQSTVQDAESRLLDADERAALLEDAGFDLRAYQGQSGKDEIAHPSNDDSLTRTVFRLVNWGTVDLLHAQSVRCAVSGESGLVVDVTSLVG
jgi:hypothetical protein